MLSIGLINISLLGFIKNVLLPRCKSLKKLLVFNAVKRRPAPSVVSLQFSNINYLILVAFSDKISAIGFKASSPRELLLMSSFTMFLFDLRYLEIMVVAVMPSMLLLDRLKETNEHSSFKAGTRAARPWLPILLSEMFRIDRILLFCNSLQRSVHAYKPNLFLCKRSWLAIFK